MARNAALSVDDAWNTVALEERLELLTRSKAEGVTFAIGLSFLIGAIAYGYDNLSLLAAGIALSFLTAPVVSNSAWRRRKPELILSYLAARSIARRYAFGYKLRPIEISLIFRGFMEDRYASAEEEALSRQGESVDFESDTQRRKEVWVCLLQGGIVILSERIGGARLEFISPITANTGCRRNETETVSVEIKGDGPARGRTVSITSSYPGALYVFEQKFLRLIEQAKEVKTNVENAKKISANRSQR